MTSDDIKKTLKDLEKSLKKMKIGKENLSKFSKDFDKTKKDSKEIEKKSKLIQRTLRDLIKFNTNGDDLTLDVSFILASNDNEIIDEIRKMYHHKNFKWVNGIDNQISDVLVEIYGLYSDN